MQPASTADTQFRFGSKAATLETLRGQLTKSSILPLVRFTLQDWRGQRETVLGNVQAAFGEGLLIVRSSSLAEDTQSNSGAGCFCSVANVRGRERLIESINEVITSYRRPSPKDEVLVQPMAEHVVASGVAMTLTPESGLPYYVINYTEGNDTAAVTGGDQHVMAYTAYKHAKIDTPQVLAGLIEALREIEQITGCSTLDTEFAMIPDGPLILQVRPMTAIGNTRHARFEGDELDALLQHEMASIHAELIRVSKDGATPQALYGIMPDWNPAEMIGVKPRPLAFSCYQNLITDVNWASARFRYGYRDMRNEPLMTLIGGTPYISIPRSIESFIPAALPQSTANSIIAACCSNLAQHRHLHDKLEFSVIPTCYVPALETQNSPFNALMQALSNEQKSQYIAELKHVSEHIISHDGPFFKDLQLIARIERRVDELKRVPDDGLHAFRQAIGAANICGELFAGAARAGFTATALLKSIELEGDVDIGLTDCLIGGVETVGKVVARDFIRLTRAEFLARHGHIRPGTYDIRVRRYDEDPER
jgi:glutamine kinase